MYTASLPLDVTLEHAFAVAAEAGADLVWLDSAVGDAELGRRSMLALELAPALELYPGRLIVHDERGTPAVVPVEGAALWRAADAALRRDARRRAGSSENTDASAASDDALGWVGYVGYEAMAIADAAYPSAHDPLPFAPARFDRVRACVFADARGVRVVAEAPDSDAAMGCAASWRERLHGTAPAASPVSLALLEAPDGAWHRANIERIIADIHAGRFYQACYTWPLWFERPADIPSAYRALRGASPGDHGAYVRMGGIEAACTSPERFVRIDGDHVVTRPMKGTLARAGDDAAERAQLAASAKDRAENVMIVDLLRNDLGRVCDPGSVRVTSLFEVETYRTVHQMTSTIEGRLRPDVGPFALLSAAFPPGSMTGAPKVEACRALAALEPSPRGLYSGVVGWLGYDGRSVLGVVIRTLQAYADIARWDVGGGIVADSTPDAEWSEALAKAAPLAALGVAVERLRG